MTDEIHTSKQARDLAAPQATGPEPSREPVVPRTRDGSVDVERAKFDLGTPPELPSPPLPWGYGVDKITALVRSPDNLFLYWEVTNEGFRAAQGRLGAAGAHGWLNLRVYDTTGREFDGTNANHYVDLPVDREQRERFLGVHRPGSSLHVEIGVMTHEGYFQPIARSNRADFPRKSPSANTWLEWMTVTSENESPTVRPYHSRFGGPPSSPPPGAPPPPEDVSTYATATPAAQTWTTAQSWTVEERVSTEWITVSPRDMTELVDLPMLFEHWRTEWRSDLRLLRWTGEWPGALAGPLATGELFAWQARPFTRVLTDLPGLERVDFSFAGVPMIVPSEWGPVQLLGPWRVTIRGFDREPERRVLGSWTIHWARPTAIVRERWITAIERRRTGAHLETHHVSFGSESLAFGQAGASEMWRLGASEQLWLGASAGMLMGASELVMWGASELALVGASALLVRGASEQLGASEWLFWGASERVALGSSELQLQGASELLAQGASEALLGGASEWRAAGASEAWSSFALGGSEHVAGSVRGGQE